VKQNKKVIRVRDLAPTKSDETQAMIAELEGRVDQRWPVRFKSTGDQKKAGRRR